jgi:8-oxo-dGTP pyrophosphatase MutT (NUDIX family)
LLVQTRGGRWIFPKGGVEAGLTQAQSAALEAFEEAGVHGRIEEMPFSRYRIGRGKGKSGGKERDGRGSAGGDESVTAHLCEVSYLEAPQEAYRNPTWFPPEKAKRRLLEDRAAALGEELAALVDRAVARIRRLETSNGSESRKDELQKVRFEAFDKMRLPGAGYDAAMARYLLMKPRRLRASSILEVKGSTTLQ